MEEYVVKILNVENVTHNVKRFQFEKPLGYSFIPGQATDVSINVPDLKNEKRPFTFTCLNSAGYLEFDLSLRSFLKLIFPDKLKITIFAVLRL